MKIVIIGGQAAGMTLATRLQRNMPQSRITVVEQNNYVSFGACGLPYYIADEFAEDISRMHARTVDDIKKLGINLLVEHLANNVDSTNKIVSVEDLNTSKIIKIPYDKLVIATGASPKVIPNLYYSYPFISNLTKLNDAKKIKDFIKNNPNTSITILGAGYIGLELLEALIKYNVSINLVDPKLSLTDNILDNDFLPILQNNIKKYPKINIYLGSKVLDIHLDDNQKSGYTISLENGSKIKTNFIVSCLGFSPNTNIIGNLKLKTLDNGAILINANGETNIKNIYACGDCASIYHKILQKDLYIPLATIANKMARKIADHISNKPNPFMGTLGSSCLKILDLEIAKTGITEYEAKQNNISYHSFFIEDYNHTDYYSNQKKLYIKILCNNNGVIIGGQIVGESGAMLRIHALSVAIEKQLTVEELSFLDFAYAPPFTRTWEALNIAGGVATRYKKNRGDF